MLGEINQIMKHPDPQEKVCFIVDACLYLVPQDQVFYWGIENSSCQFALHHIFEALCA
jgi:hypothetical protein